MANQIMNKIIKPLAGMEFSWTVISSDHGAIKENFYNFKNVYSCENFYNFKNVY